MDAFPPGSFAVVDGWSAVEAVGPDASKFLNGFCTNDVAKLADGDACEAMFTDVKARVIAYAWVARVAEERFLALLSSDRSETLTAHLDRYLIRERVELTAHAPAAWTIGCDPSGELRTPLAAFGEGVFASTESDASGDRLSPKAFERLRIRLGVPLDGVDVDERNLPQEVDRNDRAISFTKGCYLGQEPVARIDALGRVNWLLRGLEVEGPPPACDVEVTLNGKAIGRVTSSSATDAEAPASVALAYVRREHTVDDTAVTVAGGNATVRSLPMA